MNVGSLFTGYGGLDRSARAVFGGELAWVSDNHPSAVKLLAHRYPDVPNLGDITAIDWSQVEPVDLITAGFPCQDISNAGQRAGIEGARSGLWSYVVDAVRVLRPRHLVLENVSALLVRGLDRVVADLATLGYDLRWACVRASDVGAPHRRERWFGYATPANPESQRHWDTGKAGLGGVQATAIPGSEREAASHPEGPGRSKGRPEPARLFGRPDASLCGGATSSDPYSDGVREQPVAQSWSGSEAIAVQPCAGVDWGEYERAIRAWEFILGRPAPDPTEPGRNGNRVLSPRFVEHMMGLPAGWVADVPGLSRTEMLRLLGNGVVPQQGEAALRWLVGVEALRGAA